MVPLNRTPPSSYCLPTDTGVSDPIYHRSIVHLLPGYLSGLITRHQPARLLRSSGQEFLYVPRVNTNFGRHAFAYSSPTAWNSIPLHIR